jgi:adenylate kinase
MLKILKKRISQLDCKNGFILDGFPRNLKQAEMLEKITEIDKVIEISISDEEAVERISGRRICKKCNISYNIKTSPKPLKNEICDKCNEKLFQRKDDNEEAVRKRLEIYHNETESILEKYKDKVIKINGEQDINLVTEDILKTLI